MKMRAARESECFFTLLLQYLYHFSFFVFLARFTKIYAFYTGPKSLTGAHDRIVKPIPGEPPSRTRTASGKANVGVMRLLYRHAVC